MTMENRRGEPKRSLPDKLLNNVSYSVGVSCTSSEKFFHSLQFMSRTEQITGSPYSDNDCPVKMHGTARDTVPVESDVNVENIREGKLFHGYSVSDDSKLPCSEADQSKNTACGTEQVSDVDLDVIRQKEGSFKECAGDEMKSTKCETGEVVPDSGTAASPKTLEECFGVTCVMLQCIATCFGAAEWKTIANIPGPVLPSMCKTMADICCFVGSACKRLAVMSWLILASVFKEVVVTAEFTRMADMSRFVVSEVFTRMADMSRFVVSEVFTRMADMSRFVVSAVFKGMADMSRFVVSEVFTRMADMSRFVVSEVFTRMADMSRFVVSTVFKGMADMSRFVVSTVFKGMADMSRFVVSTVFKGMADISWFVVSTVFKGMADISWPVLTSLFVVSEVFTRMADMSRFVVSEVFTRMADMSRFVVSEVFTRMADMSRFVVSEVFTRMADMSRFVVSEVFTRMADMSRFVVSEVFTRMADMSRFVVSAVFKGMADMSRFVVSAVFKGMADMSRFVVSAVFKGMADMSRFVVSAVFKGMADMSRFVVSTVFKGMADMSRFIVSTVFKGMADISWFVVSTVFKGMADISWPVLTSLCKTAAFKRLADDSGVTSTCSRLATVSLVSSVCMAVSVCKRMSDIALLAVVEVWKRLTLRLGSKTLAKSKAVDVHFTGRIVTVFLVVGLLCGLHTTDATTLLSPTQPLSEQCIHLFSSTFGNDCPLSLTKLPYFIKQYYKPLNTTCCSGFPGTVFHCQTDHFDNGKGDQYTMLGCMPPVTVPRGFLGRISAYNTEKPYFRTVRDNDSPYTERFDRPSWKVPHPYHFSHFKSKCNGVGQEMFCRGTDGDDNLCTCREGFQPSGDGAFTDNSVWACVEMVCPPGSAPSRSSVEGDVACKNLYDGQYPQFTCSPASTPPPSGHPASLTTGTPPMTTPDNHDTPVVGKTGEGSLGGSVIAFVCAVIVVLLMVFTVVCGNTVKDKVCEAWYHMRGYRQPNSA